VQLANASATIVRNAAKASFIVLTPI